MKAEVCVAAVQVEPVYMDAWETTQKVCDSIDEASRSGADMVVFPECIIPMYPNWPPSGTELGCHAEERVDRAAMRLWADYWSDLVSESVAVEGKLVAQISKAAKSAGVVAVVGVNERVDEPGGPHLYNTALVFGPDGRLVGRHRKLTPFLHEKLYHTPGDLRDIAVFCTEVGRVGIGICFENLHPAYRYALLQRGEEIHCSLWVSTEPDKHLMTVSAQQHAIEGGGFVVASGQVTSTAPSPGKHDYTPTCPFVGGSAIVDPHGELLAGPCWGHETILYASLKRSAAIRVRSAFDLLGRDGRADLFENAQRRTA